MSDEACHRYGDRERHRMEAAGKYGDYYSKNTCSYTITSEASADLSLPSWSELLRYAQQMQSARIMLSRLFLSDCL